MRNRHQVPHQVLSVQHPILDKSNQKGAHQSPFLVLRTVSPVIMRLCAAPEILRYAPKDIRHVERRETSPERNTVLIPEIPHYIRDDGVFIDVCLKGAGRSG
ncbi:hypothetical protein BN59_02983 [Legionella massiliensis]|uniref:Uncharacterized protein n=1 Tax=Legionella massiliensis TaxID=1034943 RepID=A0A078L0I6_9GAMM|nr:hypothetical protein BN59_02983 [Legionella massiliensis]CEE14409.1 hypothetical protein BN1094_02983 [Legionella massiliensis]